MLRGYRIAVIRGGECSVDRLGPRLGVERLGLLERRSVEGSPVFVESISGITMFRSLVLRPEQQSHHIIPYSPIQS